MGLLDLILRGHGRGLDDLASRLGTNPSELAAVPLEYREFRVPKRSGGERRILAPRPPLRALQRRILRRVLGRLRCHPAATGFERGISIVTNAAVHQGRAVVVRMDLRDFFESTRAARVGRFLRRAGWNRPAARRLETLCTWNGSLPTGAPTSPRLANLVNQRLDRRLAGLAASLGAAYTRYADDLTFSLEVDSAARVHRLLAAARAIAFQEGYRTNGRKLRVRRHHQQQRVTGLVVNQGVNLPRSTRRWLRAVKHRLAAGRGATLSESQLRGWCALASMVATQAPPAPRA